MRILWLSNRIFREEAEKQSGTWLKSLATALSLTDGLVVGNISLSSVECVTRMNYRNVLQWAVPNVMVGRDGLPDARVLDQLKSVVAEFNPDIIQVWGTEGYWGLLTIRGIWTAKCILNIQGVLSSIEPVFDGGLTIVEKLKCIGVREIVKPSGSIFLAKRKFKKRALLEQQIIRGHRYIVTQSLWSKGHVSAISQSFVSFHTERSLRQEFADAEPWKIPNNRAPILFTSSAGRPYKGIHVIIRALAILKTRYPEIRLYISGAHISSSLKMSGYDRWLRRVVSDLALEDNIIWLGNLDADEIIANLQRCDVYVNPSFVESYSLSLAEAMYLGVPAVISYAGAMPELAADNESALFFTPGDFVGCATKIERYLSDNNLSNSVSIASRDLAIRRHDIRAIVENQIRIYQKVFQAS